MGCPAKRSKLLPVEARRAGFRDLLGEHRRAEGQKGRLLKNYGTENCETF